MVVLRVKLVETANGGVDPHKDITTMRICIFGAGAVGSHFAVRLALAGHDVCCVMRGPHLEAVKANGLTLRVGDSELKASVKVSDDPAAFGPQDVVMSTLKATGLASLANGLPHYLAKTPRWSLRKMAFPGGTISDFPKITRRHPTSLFSIPAVGCALWSQRTGSSAV